MKKYILISILTVVCITIYGQEEYVTSYLNGYYQNHKYKEGYKDVTLQYKNLEQFDNDTIAYLEYNFMKRDGRLYSGMTVQELVDMLPLPLIGTKRNGVISSFYMDVVLIVHEVDTLNFQKDSPNYEYPQIGITVGIDPMIKIDKPRDSQIYRHPFLYDLVKDRKVTVAYIDYDGFFLIEKLKKKKKKEEDE